jgi:molybdopterin converting factor small subunit
VEVENMINVSVLLFAGIRESIGKEKLILSFKDGGTLKELMESMQQEYPELENLFLSSQFIVNCNHIEPEYVLNDQDEVAILPPLGGG